MFIDPLFGSGIKGNLLIKHWKYWFVNIVKNTINYKQLNDF